EPLYKRTQSAPVAKTTFLKRFGILPRDIIFLHFASHRSPRVDEAKRFEIVNFTPQDPNGVFVSVQYHYGFMENPDMDEVLQKLSQLPKLHFIEEAENWFIYEVRGLVVLPHQMPFWKKLRMSIFK